MNIVLLCPSNMLYMPYVYNYINILNEESVDFSIINWDRLQIENKNKKNVFKDEKIGHQRKYIDYYRYRKFILSIIKEKKYDGIIVFGIQLTYFLKGFLIKEYKGRYIIDIRDYNKVAHLFNMKKYINGSSFTTISSPGYRQWLPKSDKYIINHNTSINSMSLVEDISPKYNANKIKISYIGTLTNLDINLKLIDVLKNNPKFVLIFHGDGLINQAIENYINTNQINNVIVKGRYLKDEELSLYRTTDFVNMILEDNNINNRTCLSNRLYNSAIAGKPLVAMNNSYLSNVIKEFNLGIVLDSLKDFQYEINKYITQFDEEKYREGRLNFLKAVINENVEFKNKVKEFINR